MRRWLTSSTGLKVIALVLAAITWLVVKAVTSDTRQVEGVPLEIRVHHGLQVNYTSSKTVNVTVRGTTEDLRQASRMELFAVIDLTDETAPKRLEVPIAPDAIRHPRRVRIVAIDPPAVVVRLEKITE
jgi:YbbR domain-containing protein